MIDLPSLAAPMRALPGRAARLASAFTSASLASLLWAAALGNAGAVEIPPRAEARLVNDRTVGLVFDDEAAHGRLIEEMAREFVASDVRLTPIVGLDDVQSVYDLLYMSGIDLAVVHADVLEYIARVQGFNQVYRRVRSLAEISSETVTVIANERYRTLADLTGESVNVGAMGAATDVTGTILFDTLGIEIEKTRLDEPEALAKVKSGELAAMVYIVEEPSEAFTSLSPADGVRLIALPQRGPLLEHYRTAELSGEQFPEMIRGEETVPSLELSVILAAFNWTPASPERFEKARRFTETLVDELDRLKGGEGHSELWQAVSLQTPVPGIERFTLIDDVIAARERARLAAAAEEEEEEADELRPQERQLVEELIEIELMIEQLEDTLRESER